MPDAPHSSVPARAARRLRGSRAEDLALRRDPLRVGADRQRSVPMIRRLLVSAALLTASPALAAGVPVVDSAALAQWVQQIEQLKQTYEAELRQIEEMQRQLEALTGPRALGTLLNGAADIAAREAAESLDGIVTSAIEGSALPGAGADLSDRVAELREELDLGALAAFRGSEEGQDRALAVQAGAGMAAVASAEEGYRRANAAMERVGDMIAAIETTTDLKASVDLNSRILAEVAVLLSESIRVQAAAAGSAGTEAAASARDRAAQRRFLQGVGREE
ncbi:MAG: hypothetical protein CML46_11450 [Rhodobacteraceae bacterium]|nr:hypothetical protein [Paracoccaceae bacterium]